MGHYYKLEIIPLFVTFVKSNARIFLVIPGCGGGYSLNSLVCNNPPVMRSRTSSCPQECIMLRISVSRIQRIRRLDLYYSPLSSLFDY